MAATGPVLATTSAARGFMPRRCSKGLRPLRTQNKNATVAAPMARVSTCTWPSCDIKDRLRSRKLCPSALTPINVLSWLAAIRMPDAEMKPEMTGWLRKLARKPRRSNPMDSSSKPERKASVMATAQYSGVPAGACCPMAAAVMSETTATGPTASTRLVPNTAYSSSGATLA